MRDLKKLLRFAKPYWKQALYAFITLLAMVALDLAIPRLVGKIIDQGIRGKNMGAVLSISAAMLLISALDALAEYADPEKKWPHKELHFERSGLVPVLLQAAVVYREPRYRKLIEMFPAAEVAAHRGRLVYSR